VSRTNNAAIVKSALTPVLLRLETAEWGGDSVTMTSTVGRAQCGSRFQVLQRGVDWVKCTVRGKPMFIPLWAVQ
jgi:hypothetical protein